MCVMARAKPKGRCETNLANFCLGIEGQGVKSVSADVSVQKFQIRGPSAAGQRLKSPRAEVSQCVGLSQRFLEPSLRKNIKSVCPDDQS